MMTTTTTESSEQRRFRLTIAYDGRPFRGWQSQVGGLTIQDELLAALQQVCPDIRTVQGSGRTDAGVSARGQVAHFDAPPAWSMDATAWERALNTKLPRTIRVMDAVEVGPSFHARFSAIEKEYRYRLFSGRTLPPLLLGLAWHVPGDLDLGLLEKSMQTFVGTHDFTSFCANRGDGSDEGTDKTRTIYLAQMTEKSAGDIELAFRGNGFLYKMVRFLAGSVVRVGQGRWTLDEQTALLEGKLEQKAPHCAPADGLILERVFYVA